MWGLRDQIRQLEREVNRLRGVLINIARMSYDDCETPRKMATDALVAADLNKARTGMKL